MRQLLVTILILPTLLYSQRNSSSQVAKENLKYYEEIFGEYDKQFDVFEAPEEWKDESIVVLCQKTHLSFFRKSRLTGNRTKGVIRKRVLIQDKSELETFSEFYFQTSEAIGINHIKPNGKVYKIETEEAIKVESNIPDFYSDSYHSAEYYKIAVPNLEVGDIIDYFKVFEEYYPGAVKIIAPLNYSYAVASQEIIFDVDKLWTFYYDTFNGAPSLKEDTEGGIDSKGRKRKSVKRYVLKDKNRAARKIENWSYSNLTEPIIKFMAVTTSSKYAFGESVKKGLDVKQAIRSELTFKSDFSMDKFYADCKSLTSKADVGDLPDKEKIEMAYRVMRHRSVSKFMMNSDIQRYSYSGGALEELSYDYFKISSNVFSYIFNRIMSSYDIESELVAVVPSYYGSIDDVVIPDEIEFGVYVPLTEKYYWPTDNYSLAGEESRILQGSEGYRIEKQNLKNLEGFNKTEIPYSSADKNTIVAIKEVIINDDKSIDVSENVTFKGLYKSSYNQLLLFHIPYCRADIELFGTNSLKENVEAFDKYGFDNETLGWSESRVKKYNERFDNFADRQEENISSWVKSQYDCDTVTDYKVLEYGVTEESPNLIVEYKFTASDYIKKAGPNLIFDIGLLIGEQLELDEDQLEERKTDIYFNFPKTIHNKISITLPDGLNAFGLEALNTSVDNPNGSFTATAIQEGNTLTFSTSKVYKKAKAPASEWLNYVEMLEAAYNMTQQKIILKAE